MEVYTIGYQGTDIEEFTAFLKKKKIQLIADLRKNPVSRKKGFSKNKLAEQLKLKKIDYLHLPGLGTPSAWRKLAESGRITRKQMFEKYTDEIIPRASQEIKTLRQVIPEKRVALLCYEIDATDCHRSYVTKELRRLEKKKLDIVDLEPVKPKSLTPGKRGGHALRRSSGLPK